MNAEQFLIKRLNPKSGSLKAGIINTDYAAELMEEYAVVARTGKEVNGYDRGFADGLKRSVKLIEALMSDLGVDRNIP